MADTINQLTLELANYLLKQNEGLNTVSVSGYLAYFTLLLVNFGLQGQAKYDLSAFLDCNYSFIEISEFFNFLEYECIHSFTIDEFLKIGGVKSAIFHSSLSVDNFKQIAKYVYNFELEYIDSINKEYQANTINQWTQLLHHVPFHYIVPESFYREVKLLIINEYLISFKWMAPTSRRYTHSETFTDYYSRKITVKMMRMIDHFRCYTDVDIKADIVFVNLETNGTYAVVVYPYATSNVSDVLKNMNVIDICKI
ncbi:hypothetical protein RF11_08243 [Thelohanellus kitauei]|uniref:Serpin domain-containing protein n=1 Tax=Thelohanellus kitauei TaxID=669202 RepID=A0A0C2NI10_THEKT|nr:hypothetical protein RF11_08243 [Thelohanellus kitauei]